VVGPLFGAGALGRGAFGVAGEAGLGPVLRSGTHRVIGGGGGGGGGAEGGGGGTEGPP
jgi:hypothetical protein